MNKNILMIIGLALTMLGLTKCKKPADYYSAGYLNKAENAKPGQVDSLQILAGYNKARIRFKASPDRRVKQVKVFYNTSLSALVKDTTINLSDADYGNYVSVDIPNVPEATAFVRVVGLDEKGDVSNGVEAVGTIYGEKYISSLSNRIYRNITTVDGVKQINFQNESGKPRDTTVFYTLQRTVVTYPTTTGEFATVQLSPFSNAVAAPDMAGSGTISHYSEYKPAEDVIDIFKAATVTVEF
ncbi:DUF4998 domain-containing protein [Niabella insulamsoli]|uniref:DUF4998 domain-containing protein n=1 Tax=Niabella insulamsoli TaxID=3144874 RepID=UPI0031FC7E23